MHSTEDGRFGTLLRARRVALGLTQEQLAERAGLSRRGIADLERGSRSAPYRDTLERLATALGLSEPQRDELAAAGRRPAKRRGPRVRPNAEDNDRGSPNNRLQARHNLPPQSTTFVGRDQEVARLTERIGVPPLITLVGPGGVGKTRLALEAAAALTERYADGVWLVELAPVSDPNLLIQAVASVIGIDTDPGSDLTTNLITWLRTRQVLLVLDNCEHVVVACSALASQLIRACPDVHVLATSREVLHVVGETVWPVDPLALPRNDRTIVDALESEAVRLFLDRATAAAPHFVLTDQNAPAVVHICQQLDGIPLALELAAARLRSLSAQDLATRLDQRFALLTGGARNVAARHRTLRKALDWSYELLEESERALFQELSVFSGGWTLDSAESICIPGQVAIIDVLSQLIDKSLVQLEPRPDGTGRYRMLETLRQYAAEQLDRQGRADGIRRRHALFFASAIVHRWGPFWFSVDTSNRLATIQRDYDNFRASLRWLIVCAETGAAERLAAALTMFWMRTGRIAEGIVWLREVLNLPPRNNEARPARLRLFLVVMFAQLQALGGDRAGAYAELETALESIRDGADSHVVAYALGLAASLTLYIRADVAAARELAAEALRLAERSGVAHIEASVRHRFALIAMEAGENELAERLLVDNTAVPITGVRTTISLARIRFASGQYRAAAKLLEDLLDDLESNRTRIEAALAWTTLSWVRLAEGELATAWAAGARALSLVHDNLGRTTSFGHLAGPLEALSSVAAAAGQGAFAVRLAGASARLRETYAEPLIPSERARLERWLAPARRALGPEASADALAAGSSLDAEAALAQATAMRSPTQRVPDPLTPREREVMQLAAKGLSNRQIAERLVIAEGTARVHVERILGKLGLHSRSQLAAWLVDRQRMAQEHAFRQTSTAVDARTL